ncbi:alpha/beta hydrolase [Mariniphaga sp.]|uniref:alpha/beta hydrolase n=1 Tax=Mariniphaga sp. TaxID=1954475 RepID=UPI003563BD2A
MNRIFFFLVFSLCIFAQTGFSQESAQSVFFGNQGGGQQWLTYQDNHRALYRIITNEAFSLLEERAEKVSELQSAEDWKTHQKKIKTALCGSLEKFEKTPLNAQTTGILERENCTVEKVLFESHPGFYVTAGLFLPRKRQNPAPAVIYACGHTELGFRSEIYQHVILNLVEKGFIVLAFDPLGQGERLQYPDSETGKSKVGGSTKEHSFAGVQTLLTGTSLTDYFIWDGIRVLDYLETRPEVDMKRIGMTGRSGGGTQTAQIAACDERIYAAAPECYITSFKRLLQSIGPQDAEQNPYNAIAKGFDHADYLHIRAPKPALMITTTHDFFSIQGARETFAEVQKSYAAFGKPDNIQMVEDFGVHESTKNNRESLYTFFQKHLELPGDPTDRKTTPFSAEELWVTPTGQVGTSFDCETVFNLNRTYFQEKNVSENELPQKVAHIAGIDFKRKLTAAVYTGKFTKKDFGVEKYFLENNWADYALPVYVIQNESESTEKLVVWFHPEGKQNILEEPLLAELIQTGYTVISADLPGNGELFDPDFSGDGVIQGIPFNYTFGANLAGKSIAGIQAEAIDLLMQFAKIKFPGKPAEAIVQEIAASAVLHYAVFKNPFLKITIRNFPEPVEELVRKEYYDPAVAFTAAPGSLNYYDLPDLTEYLQNAGTEIITR